MQSKFVHASLLIQSHSRRPHIIWSAFSSKPFVRLPTIDRSYRVLSRSPNIYRIQKRNKRSRTHAKKLTRLLLDEMVDEFHD